MQFRSQDLEEALVPRPYQPDTAFRCLDPYPIAFLKAEPLLAI